MLEHSAFPENLHTTITHTNVNAAYLNANAHVHASEPKLIRLVSSQSNLLLGSTNDPHRPLSLTLPSFQQHEPSNDTKTEFSLKGPVTYLSLKCPGLIKLFSIDHSSTYIAAFDQFHMLTIFKSKGPFNSWQIVYTHPLGSKVLAASWFTDTKKFIFEKDQLDPNIQASKLRLVPLDSFPSKLPAQDILISFTEMGMFFGWIPTRSSILLHKLRIPSHIYPTSSISTAPPLFHVAAVHLSLTDHFLIIAQIKSMVSLGVWTVQLSSAESLANSTFHTLLPLPSSSLHQEGVLFSHVQIISDNDTRFSVVAATEGVQGSLLLWSQLSILASVFTTPLVIKEVGQIHQLVIKDNLLFVATHRGVGCVSLHPMSDVITWVGNHHKPTLSLSLSPHGLFLTRLHPDAEIVVQSIAYVWNEPTFYDRAMDAVLNKRNPSDVIAHLTSDTARSVLGYLYTQLLPHMMPTLLSTSSVASTHPVAPSSSVSPGSSVMPPPPPGAAAAASSSPFYASPFFQPLLHFQLHISIHLRDPARHLVVMVLLHVLLLSNVYSSVFECGAAPQGPFPFRLASHVSVASLFPITRWWLDLGEFALACVHQHLQAAVARARSSASPCPSRPHVASLFLFPIVAAWIDQVHLYALYVFQHMDVHVKQALVLTHDRVQVLTDQLKALQRLALGLVNTGHPPVSFWVDFFIPLTTTAAATELVVSATQGHRRDDHTGCTWTPRELILPCSRASWVVHGSLTPSSLQFQRFMEWTKGAWDVVRKRSLVQPHALIQCTSCLRFTDTPMPASTSLDPSQKIEPFWHSAFSSVCICGGRWWCLPQVPENQ